MVRLHIDAKMQMIRYSISQQLDESCLVLNTLKGKEIWFGSWQRKREWMNSFQTELSISLDVCVLKSIYYSTFQNKLSYQHVRFYFDTLGNQNMYKCSVHSCNEYTVDK